MPTYSPIRRLAPLLLISLAAALAACQTSTLGVEDVSASRRETTTVILSGNEAGRLEIESGAGSITIQAGDFTDRIEVETVLRAFGRSENDAEDELDDMKVAIRETTSTVLIYATQRRRDDDTRTNEVDLVLTVPPQIGLTITHDTGDIHLTGLRSRAPVAIASSAGSITLDDVTVLDGLDIRHGAGNVIFEGELGQTGRYALEVDVGLLAVTLPTDTNAELDAAVTMGTLTVTGFGAEGPGGAAMSAELRATLGAGGPDLRLRMNLGDLRLTVQSPAQE